MKLFIAGDANRDSKVDGFDGQILTDIISGQSTNQQIIRSSDFNGDGTVDAADIHLYRQDLGFVPNQAPALSAVEGPVKTHIDLEIIKSVDQYISDQENDPIVYRITGATNGTARMASDGSSVSFTPTTGFFGTAGFSLVADDGYSTSQVATVTVNVSDAPLVKLDFVVRQPRLDERHSICIWERTTPCLTITASKWSCRGRRNRGHELRAGA